MTSSVQQNLKSKIKPKDQIQMLKTIQGKMLAKTVKF